jgi:hypothetical protein
MNPKFSAVDFDSHRSFAGMCLALALMLAGWRASAEDVIEFKDQTATFTNLQGKVYQDVELKRATQDGLIYSTKDDHAVGMVHYADLSPSTLTSLKIPQAYIEEAARRQQQLALQKQQYDAAAHQLALQEQTNAVAQAAAQAAAAQAAARAQSAAPAATDTTSANKTANAKAKSKHHRQN